MNNTGYNLNFRKLFIDINLGEIVGEPQPLSGGYLHHMYVVETQEGKYAVKALNPLIMLRPTAMQNMIDSENIASIALKDVNNDLFSLAIFGYKL